MTHIIITGAAILSVALASSSISRISILSRRPVKLAENNPKARVFIHKDFLTYPPDLLEELKGAKACVWAQGISSRGMKEEEYERITVGYPLAAARAFAQAGLGEGQGLNFVYMSGEGANMEEGKASMMFGRVKGKAERELLALGEEKGRALRVFNIRPAAINPQGNYLQERSPTMLDRLVTGLGGVFERVWKNRVIPTPQLAKVCLDLATGDGEPISAGVGVEAEGRLLRNSALRRLAGM